MLGLAETVLYWSDGVLEELRVLMLPLCGLVRAVGRGLLTIITQ
jgi:hypothetical protein